MGEKICPWTLSLSLSLSSFWNVKVFLFFVIIPNPYDRCYIQLLPPYHYSAAAVCQGVLCAEENLQWDNE